LRHKPRSPGEPRESDTRTAYNTRPDIGAPRLVSSGSPHGLGQGVGMMDGRGSDRARRFAVLAAIAVLLVTSGGLVGPAAADPGREQGTAVSGERGKSPSDPDGMENGGADKPGGQGGTIGAQDGNNGSGNDIDCEDDNRGQGVPAHCEAKPDNTKCVPGQAKGHTNEHGHGKARAARTTCPTTTSESPESSEPSGSSGSPESSESSEPNSSSPTPASPGGTPRASDTDDTTTRSNAGPATTGGTTDTAEASLAGSSTGEVLGVEASRTSAGTSADAEVAGGYAATAPSVSTTPTTAVLANTGASRALVPLLLLGVVAVAAGAWLLTKRGGRVPQKV
jgi:hypothetical protein